LEDWVLTRCEQEYRGVAQPQATTEDAARELFAAVEVGDRARAARVATENVLARFTPWGPAAAPPETHRFTVVNDTEFQFSLGAYGGDYFDCQGSGGIIRRCDLIQPGR
jgi:hypothetical protein